MFPTLPDGEYYWVDLVGLAVINREGVALGTVKELMSAGPQTTLVVDAVGEDEKPVERLIPFVDAFIDAVDLTAKRITVDWQADY
jgi:16S rRNA processing protein RimM